MKPNHHPISDEALRLVHDYFEGRLSDADHSCLAELLRSDRKVAAVFAQWSMTTAHLLDGADATASFSPSPGERDVTRGRFKLVSARVGFAAALLLAAVAVAVYFTAADDRPNTVEPHTGPLIATLIDSTGTLVFDDDVVYEGGEYAAGTYTLDGGRAELLLSNRVTVGLYDRTQLTVLDPMHVTLIHGSVGFKCPEIAEGFSVRLSPRVRIVDLGTAFRIVKPETGAPFVWVIEGRVRVEINGPKDAVETVELTAGQYGWVERVGSDAPRFVRHIEQTPEPIAGVSVLATSNLHGAFDRDSRHLVDGAGLDPATGRHSELPNGTAWLSTGVGFPTSAGDDRRPALTFDLGGLCLIESLRVWNYNERAIDLFKRGVKDARLLVSDDGERFRPLTDPTDGDELFTFDVAPGRDDVDFSQVVAIEPGGPVTHVRLEVVTTHEGSDFDAGVTVADGFAGLSEVRFIGTPIGPRQEISNQEADRQRTGG